VDIQVKAFFDESTSTLTYVAHDAGTGDAVIIDPVLDFDPLAWSTTQDQLKKVDDWVKEQKLKVRAVLDTHAHADHLSGILAAKRIFNVPMGMGKSVTKVQETFKDVFNFSDNFKTDGSQFDFLLDDNEEMQFGSLSLRALHTPGHTPACMSYQIGESVFVGDVMFMPDMGTGRCDFPEGSADQMYNSITNKLYTLADSTRLFVGHDYMPNGRELKWETTVAESKDLNIRLKGSTTREDFVKFRAERDKELSPPRLIFQSIQVNVNGGQLPEPEENGRRYFKIPLNLFG
jgi:glyoxylase-like metal-dependent hydrolase (beta-lactamase superfamily II)